MSFPEGPAQGTRKIALLGNHLPRLCGIATFTSDLADALEGSIPRPEVLVVAMNDGKEGYPYPGRVRFEIEEGAVRSYERAADFLNLQNPDVLCLQHEYGIFGGPAGGHLLALLRKLRMPLVTTLHTILTEPNEGQRAVMDEITRSSERLVVMTAHGAGVLQEVHKVPVWKIDIIPHGIPFVPFDCPDRGALGLEGKKVLLTFGLLSPDKGIENVIEAMPAVLARHPDAVYIVLGATHPHVKAGQGETYRRGLEERVKKLGIGPSVLFRDRFVDQEELKQFLSATDIYVTPYLNKEQTTSGTLAYAMGSGRAVISTPYWHASELLADGRGLLVPWKDPGAIAAAVIDLLSNDSKRLAMRERAAALGREMLWPEVGKRYLESFDLARTDRGIRRWAKASVVDPMLGPGIDLRHLRTMTDETGLLQHAVFTTPRREEGYCLDDNARALLLMTWMGNRGAGNAGPIRSLTRRFMAFVHHAFDPKNGRFRNFLSYSRQWAEEIGSEESHGRALWALGAAIGRSSDPGRWGLNHGLFQMALPALQGFSSPRAWAFSLLGIDEYLRAFEGDRNLRSIRKTLADRLLGLFERANTDDWPWFEDKATYCNARLSQALIVSGDRMGDLDMVEAGLRSLDWLVSIQRSKEGKFAPIGSNGFFEREGRKADFDQQPVEACGMVSASLEAGRVTGQARWLEQAGLAFRWFLGENQLQQALYDPKTGGCRDGLHGDRVNENQGAESTLSFLLALVEMRMMDKPERKQRTTVGPSVAVPGAGSPFKPKIISRGLPVKTGIPVRSFKRKRG